MPSVNTLRKAINEQLLEADNKRKRAESLMKSAEDHAGRGDYTNAQRDRDSAERYMRDVHGIEEMVAGYEIEIQRRQLKARDIDRQIDDLEQHFKHNLEQLEKEKLSIGVGILTGEDAEIIRRQLKNRGIDNKIGDLEKHHKHDLEELHRQKNDLLG